MQHAHADYENAGTGTMEYNNVEKKAGALLQLNITSAPTTPSPVADHPRDQPGKYLYYAGTFLAVSSQPL